MRPKGPSIGPQFLILRPLHINNGIENRGVVNDKLSLSSLEQKQTGLSNMTTWDNCT